MDKIWIVRGLEGDRSSYNVGFFSTEDKAFKKKEKCTREAEEDGFEDSFLVMGPYHVE